MVGRAGIAFAATLILAGSALGQIAWHTVEGPNRVFTVDMPAKPATATENSKSGGGTPFTYLSYSLDHEGRAFVIQTANYPADVDVKNPNANMKLALDASGKHLESKKWDKVSWIKFQGLPAVEAIGKMQGNLEFRNMLVMKGRQFYSVGYAGPVGSLRSVDADRFFNSLHIR
jgi:hypothetical protein